ncbi:MAG TPA: MBL fold metallo-hydrolase [Anaerolineales bacterium]|nr:MBL fold metallo-hydrolase [Anaerolineales bacterium]
MREKATFTSFETTGAAKIHRIPLEAFPDFWAYVYVVQKIEYCVLIDAGSGTDTSHANLLSGLQQAGIEPSDLTHILLTHAHIDHYGGLSKLRPITNAKIGCHELDLQTVSHHEARLALIGTRLDSFLAETGLAAETREQVLSIYHFAKAIYQSVPVDFTLELLDMRLGPFEFLHLPGHCPGHAAIRMDGVVFCGDMVVEGVTPHLSPESINPYSGLDHYLESLSRLQYWAKDAPLILNGHDEAITDLAAQITATKQNILRRMTKAVEVLREPLTIEETCRAVYGETAGYNQLLTIEKTGAYVEYLYEHGMIEIANPEELEQGKPARYQRLKDEMTTLSELEKNVYRYTHIQAGM